MGSTIQVGGLVQAAEDITEPGFNGQALWTHARRNAVGHVMGMDLDEAGEAWATITWERTGTTTDCHESELIYLGGPDTGRHP